MIFITDRDYIDINNKEKVRQILNQFTSDVVTIPSDMFDIHGALMDLGETKIASIFIQSS